MEQKIKKKRVNLREIGEKGIYETRKIGRSPYGKGE